MLQRASGVRVSGKNLDIGESLRGQAEERVHDAVAKYFDGGFRSRVTVEKEGAGFRADCTVYLDTGAVMRVSGHAHDAYSSVSQAVERIGKQMRRDKRKRQAYGNGAAEDGGPETGGASEADGAMDALDAADEPAPEGATDERPIVAEKVDRLERLSLQAALARLEADKLASLAFRNEGTGRVNVLHGRPDGAIGWLDVDDRGA